MADLDAEFAAFQAELAAVEQHVQPQAAPTTSNKPVLTAPPSTVGAPPSRATIASAAASTVILKMPPPSQPAAVTLAAPPPAIPPPMAPPPAMPPPQAINPYGGAPPLQQPYGYDGGASTSYADDPTYGVPPPMPGQPAAGKGDRRGKHAPDVPGQKRAPGRSAGGERWRDPTLNEWPENDFRIFVGDLGNDCTDEILTKAFNKYSSFAKAKIVRDSKSKKSRGYGFVSFLEAADFAKAIREMDGKYIGNRPCKLSKSTWDDRNTYKGKGGGGNANKKPKR